jgi:hypothetical protein
MQKNSKVILKNLEVSMLSKIEKSIFFPLVRIVGFIFALVLLIGMIAGILLFFHMNSIQHMKTYVSFEDVQKSFSPKILKSISTKNDSKLKYSESVKKYMQGENAVILEEWLNVYDFDIEKQNFLDNLTDVILEAEKKDADIIEFINHYKTLKHKKTTEDIFGISKFIDPAMKFMIILLIGFLIFTTVVILLLLLSIERNTRRVD